MKSNLLEHLLEHPIEELKEDQLSCALCKNEPKTNKTNDLFSCRTCSRTVCEKCTEELMQLTNQDTSDITRPCSFHELITNAFSSYQQSMEKGFNRICNDQPSDVCCGYLCLWMTHSGFKHIKTRKMSHICRYCNHKMCEVCSKHSFCRNCAYKNNQNNQIYLLEFPDKLYELPKLIDYVEFHLPRDGGMMMRYHWIYLDLPNFERKKPHNQTLNQTLNQNLPRRYLNKKQQRRKKRKQKSKKVN